MVQVAEGEEWASTRSTTLTMEWFSKIHEIQGAPNDDPMMIRKQGSLACFRWTLHYPTLLAMFLMFIGVSGQSKLRKWKIQLIKINCLRITHFPQPKFFLWIHKLSYKTINSSLNSDTWITKNSIHKWIPNKDQSNHSLELMKTNSQWHHYFTWHILPPSSIRWIRNI